MNEKSGIGGSVADVADSPSRQALRQLVDPRPERHDLVMGFVGAIGTAWNRTLRAFEKSLRRFDYGPKRVHVAGLLDDLEYKAWGPPAQVGVRSPGARSQVASRRPLRG